MTTAPTTPLIQRLPFPNQLGLLAAITSAALLAGAYYFQYVLNLPPCDLCWLQRYPHMVAITCGLLSFLAFGQRKISFFLALLAIAALFVTAGIGVFHVGVEQHWWQGPQECSGRIPPGLSTAELRKFLFSAKMVRCDEPAWKMWGVSMAGWNAILSAGIAILLSLRVAKHIRELET